MGSTTFWMGAMSTPARSKHSALAPEVVLHVDDDHRSPRRIDSDRLRRGFNELLAALC